MTGMPGPSGEKGTDGESGPPGAPGPRGLSGTFVKEVKGLFKPSLLTIVNYFFRMSACAYPVQFSQRSSSRFLTFVGRSFTETPVSPKYAGLT